MTEQVVPRWAEEEEIEILEEKAKVNNVQIHTLSFVHNFASLGRRREGGFRKSGSETISRAGLQGS